jgi:tRNA/tmRNA/rRNA uracil-C5-methylase (TrmA/RlmC/RlmD family)
MVNHLLYFYQFEGLLFSAHNRCTSDQNPFELIHGNEFIYEIYNGKKFRISPESFIQVNKKSAELVYASTLNHAEIDENTIVLDIGSGIGKEHQSFS